MKFRVMTLAVLVGAAAGAEDGSTRWAIEDARVIAALNFAWSQSGNGTTGVEASFRLDANPSGYEVVATPFTNQMMKQNLTVVRGKTLVIFHVHPAKAEPAPSRHDISIADRYGLKMLTLHNSGLYEYDPVTRRITQLRTGVGWLATSPQRAQSTTASPAAGHFGGTL